MKKCPYCAEEIKDEAIKCRHCGEMLRGHLFLKATTTRTKVLLENILRVKSEVTKENEVSYPGILVWSFLLSILYSVQEGRFNGVEFLIALVTLTVLLSVLWWILLPILMFAKMLRKRISRD